MITLLSKIFIRENSDIKSPATRQAYGMLCGAVGIFLNLCLFAGKFFAGLVSHSIAITADAFNNLSDAGSSIITLIGFKMAGQKPDPHHPFGHGRIEYISGLLVAILILLMGVELLETSVSKIFHPEELSFSPLILVILVVSILVKCYMSYYNRTLGKKLDSAAMLATAADSFSDSLATAVVLLSTLISHFTGLAIDGWCGILVGLFICYSGYSAAKDTISPLLGQAPDSEFVQQVNDIVMDHRTILGIHDLIVHNYGPGRTLISLHAEVPADGDILELHDLIDTIEHELRNTLNCHAVIHMDPVCVGDEETLRLKELVKGYLAEIDGQITMHDFRIVTGPTHTNLIFDVVVPYGFPMEDEALISAISERVRRDNPDYFTVIEVDQAMV
ncbi:MAG: cation diffusion facilitator family transporter [Lachnospiraceae bacterium]|nr:cation diffusion facilitator family transporter [Lachnospiraceae bacterium]MCM1238811.1 cation diffusion facilitator family transporter [Lachnospiraceae bacterium]